MKADEMPLAADLREEIQHGSVGFPLQYYVDELHTFKGRSIPLHWHNALEFVVMHQGTTQIQAGDTTCTIPEGDGIFLNANILHGFQQAGTPGTCECPNIVFSDEFLAPIGSAASEKYIKPLVLGNSLSHVVFRRETPWQRDVLDRLDMVFSLLQKYGPEGAYGAATPLDFAHRDVQSDCYEMAVQAELLQIWQSLYTHRDEIEVHSRLYDSKTQMRMRAMLQYIERNYQGKLTLEDIAASAGIGKSECARCFHKYTRNSPIEYLIELRIGKAKKLLLSGHDGVEAVAAAVGFDSSTYFCRAFKRRTNMTPGEYRAARPAGA